VTLRTNRPITAALLNQLICASSIGCAISYAICLPSPIGCAMVPPPAPPSVPAPAPASVPAPALHQLLFAAPVPACLFTISLLNLFLHHSICCCACSHISCCACSCLFPSWRQVVGTNVGPSRPSSSKSQRALAWETGSWASRENRISCVQNQFRNP